MAISWDEARDKNLAAERYALERGLNGTLPADRVTALPRHITAQFVTKLGADRPWEGTTCDCCDHYREPDEDEWNTRAIFEAAVETSLREGWPIPAEVWEGIHPHDQRRRLYFAGVTDVNLEA